MRLAIAALAGGLFALGLVIAGMTTPANVTAFLDVGGAWDPTLAFVMAAAIATYAPVARLVKPRRQPIFDTRFHWPEPRLVDRRLVGGAAIFGIGWGLSGYCPGPAITSLGRGSIEPLVFVGAMIAGIAIARSLSRR
ncbi:MAG: protein of unknown function YeeE/YedE [Deltaproteobacteria bacterium]|nr:protein of unknown function YeeE/YedE [Deltaproteobacteria bacterium]